MAGKKPLPSSATMAEIARGRASLYDLLVYVFGRLPDMDLIVKIKGPDLQSLLDIGYRLDNSRLKSGIDCVHAYQAVMDSKSDEEILTELSVDRTRILRATGNVNLMPPYEGLYRRDRNVGASALEVKNCYRRAGLLPDETILEPPDYLCVELDFMNNLCRREQEQWLSAADVTETVASEEEFLREHLGGWVGLFCSRAEEYALTEFYRGFLAILDAVVSMDMKYLHNLIRSA